MSCSVLSSDAKALDQRSTHLTSLSVPSSRLLCVSDAAYKIVNQDFHGTQAIRVDVKTEERAELIPAVSVRSKPQPLKAEIQRPLWLLERANGAQPAVLARHDSGVLKVAHRDLPRLPAIRSPHVADAIAYASAVAAGFERLQRVYSDRRLRQARLTARLCSRNGPTPWRHRQIEDTRLVAQQLINGTDGTRATEARACPSRHNVDHAAAVTLSCSACAPLNKTLVFVAAMLSSGNVALKSRLSSQQCCHPGDCI